MPHGQLCVCKGGLVPAHVVLGDLPRRLTLRLAVVPVTWPSAPSRGPGRRGSLSVSCSCPTVCPGPGSAALATVLKHKSGHTTSRPCRPLCESPMAPTAIFSSLTVAIEARPSGPLLRLRPPQPPGCGVEPSPGLLVTPRCAKLSCPPPRDLPLLLCLTGVVLRNRSRR